MNDNYYNNVSKGEDQSVFGMSQTDNRANFNNNSSMDNSIIDGIM